MNVSMLNVYNNLLLCMMCAYMCVFVCVHTCVCVCVCVCVLCMYMHVLLVFKIGENLVLYPTLFQIPYCIIF